LLLWKALPDFFVRSLFWFRSLGQPPLKAIGMKHLPTRGPVILANNCDRLNRSLQVMSATDRNTLVVLVEDPRGQGDDPLLRAVAGSTSVIEVRQPSAPADWNRAREKALKAIDSGHILAITVDGASDVATIETYLEGLRSESIPVLPVWCGPLADGPSAGKIRVVFGEPASSTATVAELREAIHRLRDWVHANDAIPGTDH